MKTLFRCAGPVVACLALSLLLPLSVRAQPDGGRRQPEGGKKVDLRPKFAKGQTTKYKMEVTNTSDPSGATTPSARQPPGSAKPQQSDQLRSKMELGISLKVQSVSEAREATVDLVFDSVKISTKTKDASIEFDSTKPSKDEGDMGALLLQGLTGSTLTLKVDQNGNITSVSGGEAFSALGQFIGSGATGQAGQLFGPLFSIKQGNGMATVGESWENMDQIDNSMLGKFKMTTRHTLRTVMGADAQVDVVGRIEPSTEAPSDGVAQIKNSKFAGKYSWDTSIGMLRQMDSTMTIQMDQTAGGVKTSTKNEAVMKVTRLR